MGWTKGLLGAGVGISGNPNMEPQADREIMFLFL